MKFVACVPADAGGRVWIGLLPISVTWPLNVLSGMRVDRDLRRLAELHVRDVRSRRLRLRPGSTDMSASVSSTVPALFIVPITTVSPSWMLRRVTMPSIGDSMRTLLRSYCALSSVGALLRDAARLRVAGLLALGERRLGDLHVVLRLVERFARRQLLLPELLLARRGSAAPARAARAPVSTACRICSSVDLGGLQRRGAAVDARPQRLRVDLQQELALLDAVAFVDREVRRRGPTVSALMLTSRFGWILPDAETIASRSRVLIASVVTVEPLSCLKYRLAPTTAAPTSTTPTR